jgi:hypothetical protein
MSSPRAGSESPRAPAAPNPVVDSSAILSQPAVAAAAARAAARKDAALDLVAALFPRDTIVTLRARDRAAARDPQLQLLAAIAFPH